MLQRLQEKENNSSKKSGPRALVMSPTRELALQTFRFTKQVGFSFVICLISSITSVNFIQKILKSLPSTPVLQRQ